MPNSCYGTHKDFVEKITAHSDAILMVATIVASLIMVEVSA